MISFSIKLAEKVIEVNANYPATKEFCRDYLTDEPKDLSVSVNISDIIAEEVAVQSQEKFPPQFLETLALYRKIAKELSSYGVILFHGSAIAVDGEAYVFTAKSGTGKSTHTALWRKMFGQRAVMINDDKPLIAVRDGEIVIYGTPWCGKHKLGTNVSAPLKAICILERAENNSIEKISSKEAVTTVFAQTYRFNEPFGMTNVLACVDRMVNTLPAYRLKCNMNDDAALVAYNGMNGEEK